MGLFIHLHTHSNAQYKCSSILNILTLVYACSSVSIIIQNTFEYLHFTLEEQGIYYCCILEHRKRNFTREMQWNLKRFLFNHIRSTN